MTGPSIRWTQCKPQARGLSERWCYDVIMLIQPSYDLFHCELNPYTPCLFAISVALLQTQLALVTNKFYPWRVGRGEASPLPTEGFGDLSLPKQYSNPPNWSMKHYKSVEFCQFLHVKPPLHKRKAAMLKTFWRQFWVERRYTAQHKNWARVTTFDNN